MDDHVEKALTTFQSEAPLAVNPRPCSTEELCVTTSMQEDNSLQAIRGNNSLQSVGVNDSLPFIKRNESLSSIGENDDLLANRAASSNNILRTEKSEPTIGESPTIGDKCTVDSDKNQEQENSRIVKGTSSRPEQLVKNDLILSGELHNSNTHVNITEKQAESMIQKIEIHIENDSEDANKMMKGLEEGNVIKTAAPQPLEPVDSDIPGEGDKAGAISTKTNQKSSPLSDQTKDFQVTTLDTNNSNVNNEKGSEELAADSTQPNSVRNSTESSQSKNKMLTPKERLELFADFSSQSDSDTDGGDRLWIAEAMDTDEGGDMANTNFPVKKSRNVPVQSSKPNNLDTKKDENEKSQSVTPNVNSSRNLPQTVSEISDPTPVMKNSSSTNINHLINSEKDSESNAKSVVSDSDISEQVAQTQLPVSDCDSLPKEATSVDLDTLSDRGIVAETPETVHRTETCITQSKHSSHSTEYNIPALQGLIDDIDRKIKKEPEDYHEFDTPIASEPSSCTISQPGSNVSQKTLSNQLLAPPRPVKILQNVASSQSLPTVNVAAATVKQSGKSQQLAYLVPVSSVRTQPSMPAKAVTKVSFANREKTAGAKVSHTLATLPRTQGTKLVNKIGSGTSSIINIQSVGLHKITELIARKNQIPNYKPPPAPSKFFQSQPSESYHVCYECGDTFYLEKSLLYHQNRMSMRIKYKCEMCHTDVFFYNKCMFLSHLRNHLKIHKSQAVPIHIKSDSISISLVKENVFSRQQNLQSEPVVELYTSDKGKDSTAMTKFSNNVKNVPSEKSTSCHMCYAHFVSDVALATHYGKNQTYCKFNHFCGFCHFYLPSTCALKAHRNLHNHSNVLICPDCGISMLPESRQKFYHHLIEKCSHFSRFITFNCSKCNASLNSSAALKDHLMTNVNQYFKCKSCPMAFKTLVSFKNHFADAHDEKMIGTVTRVVFRCHICDCVMDNKTVLEIHIGVHMTDAKKDSIAFKFRCRYCPQVCDTQNKLSDHISTQHVRSNPMKCHSCDILFETKKDLVQHHLNSHNTIKESKKIESCIKCGYLYLDKDRHCGHETNAECCNFTYNCPVCAQDGHQTLKTPKQLAVHLKKHQDDGILVCHKCGKNSFSQEEAFNKHLQSCMKTLSMIEGGEEGLRKIEYIPEKDVNSDPKLSPLYPCHLCALTYENNSSLKRHIKIVHEGKRHVYPCYVCRKKNVKKCFSKRLLLERHLATRHHLHRNQWDESQISREYPDLDGIQFPSDNISVTQKRKAVSKDIDSPVKRLRVEGENKFVCAKCEFSCPEREKFLEHIIGHTMKNSVQCLECGLCFAVTPSLRKHLFIVHKVKDFEQYCEDNAVVMKEREDNSVMVNSTSEEDDDNEEVDVESNPLVCHICSLSFESEMACKTHMRTHGMAFLRAKRKEAKDKVSPSSVTKVEME